MSTTSKITTGVLLFIVAGLLIGPVYRRDSYRPVNQADYRMSDAKCFVNLFGLAHNPLE